MACRAVGEIAIAQHRANGRPTYGRPVQPPATSISAVRETTAAPVVSN